MSNRASGYIAPLLQLSICPVNPWHPEQLCHTARHPTCAVRKLVGEIFAASADATLGPYLSSGELNCIQFKICQAVSLNTKSA